MREEHAGESVALLSKESCFSDPLTTNFSIQQMTLDFSSLYLNAKNIFMPIHFILNAYELEKLWGL